MACKVACPYGAISEIKKEVGTIYIGENYNVNLVSSELKLGELASGEIVAGVRKYSDKVNKKVRAEVVIIGSSPGIGRPVNCFIGRKNSLQKRFCSINNRNKASG